MSAIGIVACCALAVAMLGHILTVALTLLRVGGRGSSKSASSRASVTIIRPVCGLDHFDALTLQSTFELDHPDFEIIFCAAREADPAVPLVRALIAANPHARARLLIGDDAPTDNPKLNNIVKGWNAARSEWVVIADSNVLMPPDYMDQLLASWSGDTGLVCSPPLASRPAGFWAEVECAFLNTYQARWQLAADAVGLGFAQGKSMLWRRSDLNDAGGVEALALEIAEDAAATKIVRERGKRVRLVNRPFEQPLGPRRARQVWDRQVRWARLRRTTFPLFYAPEILTGGLVPMLAAAAAASAIEVDAVASVMTTAAVWYGAEAALAGIAGWRLSWRSPAAWLARDLLLPALWIDGLVGDGFTWRGNDMTVARQSLDDAAEGRAG